METFGKGGQGAAESSATVISMQAMRLVVRLGGLGVLLLGGLAAALLAAGQSPAGMTTGTIMAPNQWLHDQYLYDHSDRAPSTAPAVLAVSGHGWGHGLGLSQFGAYGYANHGWSYDRILAHYYSGTTLGPAKVATVRVLLAAEKKTSLNSIVAWTCHRRDGHEGRAGAGHPEPQAEARDRRAAGVAAAVHLRRQAAARRRRQALPRQDRRLE